MDRICNEEGCTNPVRLKKTKGEYKPQWKCQSCEHLKHEYGINTPQRDQMIVDQDSKCMICFNGPLTVNKGRHVRMHHAVVDHCHETGKVRGILCQSCNVALGNFADDIEILQSAIDYLKQSREET